jgi:hypothetical protein
VPTIEEIYLRVKEAHNKTKNQLLRIDEVKEIVSKLWEDLFNLYEKDSIEWRIIDKGRKEHTDWWSAPTVSNYAKDKEATNLKVIIQVVEKITGKVKLPKASIPTNNETENSFKLNLVTGRTRWDFLSELHRHYKLQFVIVAILLFLYLEWS